MCRDCSNKAGTDTIFDESDGFDDSDESDDTDCKASLSRLALDSSDSSGNIFGRPNEAKIVWTFKSSINGFL